MIAAKTNKFALNSVYLDNIRSIAKVSPHYTSHNFTFCINKKFKIEVPEIFASAISVAVTRLIETDVTTKEFNIEIEPNNSIETALEKISKVLTLNESVSLETFEENVIFAEFGRIIGNRELISPLAQYLETLKLEDNTLVENFILKLKYNIENIQNEINELASRFSTIKTNQKFVAFAKDVKNINILEQIMQNKFLCLNNEDELLNFILLLINANSDNSEPFICLLDNVYLEFCSVSLCAKFVGFADNLAATKSMKSVISCLGRFYTQSTGPIRDNTMVKKGRHYSCIEFRKENSCGMLEKQHNENNLSVVATKGTQNPSVTISMRNGDSFLIKDSDIKFKNESYRNGLTIEGQRETDEKWFKISSINSDGSHVQCPYKLKAIRITSFVTPISSPFGAKRSAFGSNTSGFGAKPPAFGSNTSGFGAKQPAFGSNTSGFGAKPLHNNQSTWCVPELNELNYNIKSFEIYGSLFKL